MSLRGDVHWSPSTGQDSKNKDTLDAYVDVLIKIAEEAKTLLDLLHNAPSTTQFGRMVEVRAARELVLGCWLPEGYDLNA